MLFFKKKKSEIHTRALDICNDRCTNVCRFHEGTSVGIESAPVGKRAEEAVVVKDESVGAHYPRGQRGYQPTKVIVAQVTVFFFF